MNIICQICSTLIARAEPKDLSIPIHGDMLSPPYDGMSNLPFPATEWEALRCPVCSYRPFLNDDRVLTDDGVYKIPKFICDDCGKSFESARALNGHRMGMARKGKKKTDG